MMTRLLGTTWACPFLPLFWSDNAMNWGLLHFEKANIDFWLVKSQFYYNYQYVLILWLYLCQFATSTLQPISDPRFADAPFPESRPAHLHTSTTSVENWLSGSPDVILGLRKGFVLFFFCFNKMSCTCLNIRCYGSYVYMIYMYIYI